MGNRKGGTGEVWRGRVEEEEEEERREEKRKRGKEEEEGKGKR